MTPLPHVLDRSVVIRASRELVFRYFTDSARFARWWGDGSTIDGRVGGAVRIVYPDRSIAAGTVTQLEPDRTIVFTYGYDDPAKGLAVGASLVTVRLHDHPEGTLVELRHELPTSESRDQHVPGWRFQLAQFANVAASEQHAGAAAMADRWFAAWGEADVDARQRALIACATEDVVMQDAWSCLRGVGELQDHIATFHRHFPPATLARTGDVRHCQGTALVEWIATGADGRTFGEGTNVFRFGPDGRIAGVVGLPAGRASR